jgi:hypothetical protein
MVCKQCHHGNPLGDCWCCSELNPLRGEITALKARVEELEGAIKEHRLAKIAVWSDMDTEKPDATGTLSRLVNKEKLR